jgi:uncharacterized protein YfaQ (DUF2300 family)
VGATVRADFIVALLYSPVAWMSARPRQTCWTSLIFEGARVRPKDDALNLTVMWRAAGAPASYPLTEWQRQTQATDFIYSIADTMGKADGFLIWAKEGRDGGTWAHRQIGMAYAEYLSRALPHYPTTRPA